MTVKAAIKLDINQEREIVLDVDSARRGPDK